MNPEDERTTYSLYTWSDGKLHMTPERLPGWSAAESAAMKEIERRMKPWQQRVMSHAMTEAEAKSLVEALQPTEDEIAETIRRIQVADAERKEEEERLALRKKLEEDQSDA